MKTDSLHQDHSGQINPDYLIVSANNTKYVLPVKDIVRLEAIKMYTAIFVNSKEQFIYTKHLKLVCYELPPIFFFRIHKSSVVNLKEVKGYREGRGGQVIMSDNRVLDVSVRKKKAFLKRWHETFNIPFEETR